MNLMEATDEEVEQARLLLVELVGGLETMGVRALISHKDGLDALLAIVAGAASLNEAKKLTRIKRLIDLESGDDDSKMG
jgi:hypothetical protein